MGYAILRDILIIFLVAIPVVLIAQRLRFPSIVGFLLTGLAIGPHALRLIPNIEEIRLLAEVGVALLLFSIGLEFSFDRLKGWGRWIIGMGLTQVFFTTAIAYGVGLAFGWGSAESLVLGFAVALSSTAIVMAILSRRRWFDAPAGRIATGMLILQDLAVIPMMVIIKLMAGPVGVQGVWVDVAVALLKLVGLGLALVVLSRWVLRPALHHVALPRSRELFIVAVVGLAVGAAYVTERMGLSFALGAFLAGLLVSTTEYRFHALSEISPFRYCFNGLFFVAVGMIVDPVFVAQHWVAVTSLVLIILVAKAAIVTGSVLVFGYPVSVAVIAALMLAQVGEFSFLLVFTSWNAGVIQRSLYHLIVDASAITMMVAPFLVAVAPRLGERLAHITWRIRPLMGREGLRIPEEEERLKGHAIICGFGPLGMTVGHLLERHSVPYVVLELNPATAEKFKRADRRIYIGDGASAALLHHVGIERARLLAIAVPDYLHAAAIIYQARRLNPDIYIVSRSRYRDQSQELYSVGSDVVICEELEAGVEMGRYVLSALGMPKDEVAEIIEEIRAFGSADFF